VEGIALFSAAKDRLKHPNLALAGLILVDVFHRLLQLAAGPFGLHFDATSYWRMGKALADGVGLLAADPTGFRVPGYPIFLAFFQWLFGQHALEAAIVVQNLLGMGVALMVAGLCRRVGGLRWLAPLGYGMAALCVGRIQYDQQVMSESLFVFLLTLHLSWLLRAQRSGKWQDALIAGLSIAAATLTRPVAALLAPLELAILLAFHFGQKVESRPKLVQAWVFVAATMLPISIWVARNLSTFGEVALVRPSGIVSWEHTFRPNGPKLDVPNESLRILPAGIDVRNGWVVEAALREKGWSSDRSEEWMRRVIREAKARAGLHYYARLLQSFGRFWLANEEAQPFYLRESMDSPGAFEGQATWQAPGLVQPFLPILKFVYRYPVWLQGLFSIVAWAAISRLWSRGGQRRIFAALALTIMVYFASVTVIEMYPLYRFRLVLQPVMIISIACALADLSVRRERSALSGVKAPLANAVPSARAR